MVTSYPNSCSSLLTIDPQRGRICLSWTMKPSPCSAISSLHRWMDIACKNISIVHFRSISTKKCGLFIFLQKCLKCEVSIIEKYTSYVRLLWAGQGIFPVFPCWQDTNPLDPIAFSSRKCQKRRLARFVSKKCIPEKNQKCLWEKDILWRNFISFLNRLNQYNGTLHYNIHFSSGQGKL